MKNILVILVVSLFCTLTVLAKTNSPETMAYTTIHVSAGDTVWRIAGKYITDKEDIRDLIAEIVKVNGLDKNASLHPGQVLKIPNKRG